LRQVAGKLLASSHFHAIALGMSVDAIQKRLVCILIVILLQLSKLKKIVFSVQSFRFSCFSYIALPSVWAMGSDA
jgi:hypothetical protein